MLKYRIETNRNECISCGVCYTLDPSHFESDEDGKSMLVGGEQMRQELIEKLRSSA